MPSGRFITFEGGEGVGKSTQLERLRRRLEGLGADVVVTREPGGSPKAEAIRAKILGGHVKSLGSLAEAVLFSAARADHLDNLIRPALARGAVVLCDRFADSTRAYQGALGALDAGVIRALERAAVRGTRPDLTLVLDAAAETGLARAGERRGSGGADRFEAESTSFHERIRRAFLDIAASEPERCSVVDASMDENEVEAAVWRAVQDRLGISGDRRAGTDDGR